MNSPKKCPHCNIEVSPKNYKRHIKKRCPLKKPSDLKSSEPRIEYDEHGIERIQISSSGSFEDRAYSYPAACVFCGREIQILGNTRFIHAINVDGGYFAMLPRKACRQYGDVGLEPIGPYCFKELRKLHRFTHTKRECLEYRLR